MMRIGPTAHGTGARTLGILQLFADRSFATAIHASASLTAPGSPRRDFRPYRRLRKQLRTRHRNARTVN